MISQTKLDLHFKQNRDRYLAEWMRFLSFPSISTESAHDDDCLACARWLAEHLKDIGFQSRLLPSSGKPVVFAERKGDKGKPVILFYGHYDVQPVDPIEKWQSSPFEPEIRNGRVYARGAQDNKGQLFYTLKAIETLIAEKSLRSTVKIMLEGEEESGSKGITESLSQWRDFIQADVLMVTDTGVAHSGAPAIVMGLRGIVHLTVELTGPDHDLHSGVHGGVAPNPAQGMIALLAGLHNADGSIAPAGFYDGIVLPSERELRLADQTPFDEAAYRNRTGVAAVGGEGRYSPVERAGFRPSLDINGIHSGYGGDGVKTVIPAVARAKITARLVEGQDPAKCLAAIISHLEDHTPSGLTLSITEKGVGGGGFRLNPDSAIVMKAKTILDCLTGQPAVHLWEGASIPIVSLLSGVSQAEPLLVGFGREEDNIHAPNESFSLEQFRLGYTYAGLLLSSL